MVISGGEHKEWPREISEDARRWLEEKAEEHRSEDLAPPDFLEDDFRQYHGGDGYDDSYDDLREKETEMQLNTEHEEATWEWMLEQGPPQDDDIMWLKQRAYGYGRDSKRERVEGHRVRNLEAEEKLACL